jgi:hypothetical protein
MKAEWLNPYPGTRGFSRIFPKSGGKAPREKFLWSNHSLAMDFHRRLDHSSRPCSAYFVTWRLDGSLPVSMVTDLWTRDGPKFVELDQLLDAVSTGPRWLERRDGPVKSRMPYGKECGSPGMN